MKHIDQSTCNVLPSCIIDVHHFSALTTLTRYTTLANRGGVGETLVTPSGRGLVKRLEPKRQEHESSQTTHQQQQPGLDNPTAPSHSFKPSSLFPECGMCWLKVVLGHVGQSVWQRGNWKLLICAWQIKSSSVTAGCLLGYTTHPDSSAPSAEWRNGTKSETFCWIGCELAVCTCGYVYIWKKKFGHACVIFFLQCSFVLNSSPVSLNKILT